MSMLAVGWRFWFFSVYNSVQVGKKLHVVYGLTDREIQSWHQWTKQKKAKEKESPTSSKDVEDRERHVLVHPKSHCTLQASVVDT